MGSLLALSIILLVLVVIQAGCIALIDLVRHYIKGRESYYPPYCDHETSYVSYHGESSFNWQGGGCDLSNGSCDSVGFDCGGCDSNGDF